MSESVEDHLTPPKAGIRDAIRGGVGAVPVVSGVINETINAAPPLPKEIKLDVWREVVARELRDLKQEQRELLIKGIDALPVELGFSEGGHTTRPKAAKDEGSGDIRKFGVCLRFRRVLSNG